MNSRGHHRKIRNHSSPLGGNGRTAHFELLRRGGEVYVGKSEDNEVDFVVKKYDGQLEYYQVAYTVNDEKTLERELSSLRRIRDNYPKYLLTTDFDNSIIDGIKKINLIDWLLDSK